MKLGYYTKAKSHLQSRTVFNNTQPGSSVKWSTVLLPEVLPAHPPIHPSLHPFLHPPIHPPLPPSIHPSLHPHKLYACTWLRKSEVSYYLFCTLERFFIIFNFTISHFSLTGKVHCTLEQREGSRPQPPGSRESESSLQWALGTRGSSIALNSTNSRS